MMTDKAYIVADEQQEREVLEKLEREGYVWVSGGEKPTEWSPSRWGNDGYFFFKFPYALVLNNGLSWTSYITEDNYDIVFDGRKEEKMSKKYIVSQEFMHKLVLWKLKTVCGVSINEKHITKLPNINFRWWLYDEVSNEETNNRLIAIIRWVNGEDVFEIEKPKKWVVRSKEPQGSVDGEPLYIWFVDELTLETETEATMPPYIRRFNTKEEAQSWANSHQEVIEVEE